MFRDQIEAAVNAYGTALATREDTERPDDDRAKLIGALERIAKRERLRPAPGYEHTPLIAVEMAWIADGALRRAALAAREEPQPQTKVSTWKCDHCGWITHHIAARGDTERRCDGWEMVLPNHAPECPAAIDAHLDSLGYPPARGDAGCEHKWVGLDPYCDHCGARWEDTERPELMVEIRPAVSERVPPSQSWKDCQKCEPRKACSRHAKEAREFFADYADGPPEQRLVSSWKPMPDA